MPARFWRLLLVLAVYWPAVTWAQPVPLFHSEPGQRLALSERQALALEHLEASPGSVAIALGYVASDAFVAPQISVALPGGHQFVLDHGETVYRPAGDFTWLGLTDDPASYGLFVVRDGMVTGSVHDNGRVYTLNPVGEGLHALVTIDQGAIPDHPEDWEEFQAAARAELEREAGDDWSRSRTAGRSASNDAATGPVITLLVAYDEATAAVSDIEALIQLAIDETNLTYRLSGVNHRVALAHAYQTETPTSRDMRTDLPRMRDNGDGYFDEMHALRAEYDADLVMLIGEYNDYCGLAYLWANVPRNGFGIVARDCVIGRYVVAHEIGHNLGAHHNAEDAEGTPWRPYGFGTQNRSLGWRTVMAYNSTQCLSNYCSRLPFFSTPLISYNGTPLGDPATRDNVRVMNETSLVVAGHFGTTAGAAASVNPVNLDVTLNPGELQTVEFEVASVGDGVLHWEAWAGGASASSPEALTSSLLRSYTWRDSRHPDGPPFDFQEISLSGRILDPADLETTCNTYGAIIDGFWQVDLPFAFPFHGSLQRSISVGMNGLLSFDHAYRGCTLAPQPIPNRTLPNALIAPLWMSYTLDEQGGVYTRNLGDGRFAVQWVVPRIGQDDLRVFQAVLYDTGEIRFLYPDPGRFEAEARVAIGVEAPDGRTGVGIERPWRDYPFQGLAIHFSPTIRWLSVSPASGTLEVGQRETVSVAFDTNRLNIGDYAAEIYVRTNDPLAPVATIPVTLSVGTVSTESGGHHEPVALEEIYPNPATASTTIVFSLARPAPARVAVYDVLGREVAVLAEGEHAAGQHAAQWDAAGVASGVYVVRLEADGMVATRRVTVLR
jgi:hypothetical protein